MTPNSIIRLNRITCQRFNVVMFKTRTVAGESSTPNPTNISRIRGITNIMSAHIDAANANREIHSQIVAVTVLLMKNDATPVPRIIKWITTTTISRTQKTSIDCSCRNGMEIQIFASCKWILCSSTRERSKISTNVIRSLTTSVLKNCLMDDRAAYRSLSRSRPGNLN